MTRFSSVQKLQAKTERGKCILSHIVRSKFIVKSCFRHALLNTYVSCSKNASEIREGAGCKVQTSQLLFPSFCVSISFSFLGRKRLLYREERKFNPQYILIKHFFWTLATFSEFAVKWADLSGKNIVVLIHREACVNMANLM